MGPISLRPEFMIRGGEAHGIMWGDQYVGSMILLSREEDCLYGAIQLDEEKLDHEQKGEVDLFLHRYIEQMKDALDAPESEVTVTYSYFDHVISTEYADDERQGIGEDLQEIDEDLQEIGADSPEGMANANEEEKVVTGEDPDADFAAHVESEQGMSKEDRLEPEEDTYIDIHRNPLQSFFLELLQDEMDVLVYDLYKHTRRGHLRLGRVTLDIASLNVTTSVELIKPVDHQLREQIAYFMIDVMEDDLDFSTMSVTMQYGDEVIDEYTFDQEDQPDVINPSGISPEQTEMGDTRTNYRRQRH
jgi:hypothetical protein